MVRVTVLVNLWDSSCRVLSARVSGGSETYNRESSDGGRRFIGPELESSPSKQIIAPSPSGPLSRRLLPLISTMATNEYPKTIDLSKPRYPQDTYVGRLKHFSDLTNPLNLLATRSQLDAARTLIAEKEAATKASGQNGILASVNSADEEEKLWKAKTVVDSTLHPDTGEPIFLPFRMSAFVPTNMAVVAGMLRGGTSSVRF